MARLGRPGMSDQLRRLCLPERRTRRTRRSHPQGPRGRARAGPGSPACLAPRQPANSTNPGPRRCWLIERESASSTQTHVNMTRFDTPEDLASWAGMCPGKAESAGKHFSGRTRRGDRWLRGPRGGRLRGQNQAHLPRRPIRPARPPTRQETRPSRGRTQHPGIRLAPHDQPGGLRRPRPRALHPPGRPETTRPTPRRTTHPPRLPRRTHPRRVTSIFDGSATPAVYAGREAHRRAPHRRHPADSAGRCRPAHSRSTRPPRHRPRELFADCGQDHDTCRRLLGADGITPRIARRGVPHGSGLGRASLGRRTWLLPAARLQTAAHPLRVPRRLPPGPAAAFNPHDYHARQVRQQEPNMPENTLAPIVTSPFAQRTVLFTGYARDPTLGPFTRDSSVPVSGCAGSSPYWETGQLVRARCEEKSVESTIYLAAVGLAAALAVGGPAAPAAAALGGGNTATGAASSLTANVNIWQ